MNNNVFLLNERVFDLCDAWPLRKKYTKFVMYMFYLTVYMVPMNMDLIYEFGNLEAVIENVIDNTVIVTTYFLLTLLRFNKLVKRAIIIVKEEVANIKFENIEEKHLYFTYYNISDKFGRYAIPITSTVTILLYSTPMLQLLKYDSGQVNESSKVYKLPFRMYNFFDYKIDFQKFIIMYVYQFPILYVGVLHTSFISLLVKLILHICGKFSVLSYRIQSIPITSDVNLNTKVKEFVIAHITLITTVNTINSALQTFFLVELLQTSFRMSVIIYMIIMDSSRNFMKSITHMLYVLMITSMLYLYSFIGEQLSQESTKVSEAFYNIDWDNLSVYNQKLFLLVMSCGRQTLHVTAGKFYTFSLYGFIAIMKTSFGYVSLLRALI